MLLATTEMSSATLSPEKCLGSNCQFLPQRFFPKDMVAILEVSWPLHVLGLPSIWKLMTSECSERRRLKRGGLVLGFSASLLGLLFCSTSSPRPACFKGEGNGLHFSVRGWHTFTHFWGSKGLMVVFGDYQPHPTSLCVA